MGSFKRSFLGYRRPEVEAAVSYLDSRIKGLESNLAEQRSVAAEFESETAALSGMVVEREREIRDLSERLAEANECHARSIASLDAVTARLEDLQAQARGQATRIRMKALREAVEVSKRVQALTEAHEEPADASASDHVELAPSSGSGDATANGNGDANGGGGFDGIYKGQVKLEIGPLGDFSQLVGFEDAVGRLGASEISVERFSEGRATLSMQLDEPVELLAELEDLSKLEFKVRHTAPDNLILDVDEDSGPERHAA